MTIKKLFGLRFIISFLLLHMVASASKGYVNISAAENSDRHSYASSSVLANGDWFKISVKETGVYKLTYEQLVAMGFKNPANIRIHGYGGAMLSEDFLMPKFDDLPQLAIWMEKGSDGVFNSGDYILFYAKGPIKWEYNSTVEKFKHINNPYSNYGYYFITEGSSAASQMPVSPYKDLFEQEIGIFNDYSLYEKDITNIGHIGREFYGEDFSYNTSQNFSLSTPGIAGTNAYVNVNFIAKASSSTTVSVRINGGNLLTQSMSSASGEYERAKEVNVRGTWSEAVQESNTVNVTYGATGHTNARLNYIRINYDKPLKPYGAFTLFRNVSAINKASKFVVSNAGQNVKIWNVTDGVNITQVETKTSGNSIYFTSDAANLQEFVAIDLSKKDAFPKPDEVGKVKNQDLHSLPQPNMVIISHPDFLEQAERIADLHRTLDGFVVHTLSTEAIYNEFSSGTPDATAYRWLMKMFYDRGIKTGDENNLPRYLLLFGDGSYDNKLTMTDTWKIHEPANKILTYQSYNSLNETSSSVIDDYFGFLKDDDGWTTVGSQLSFDSDFKKALVEVGIGRFPVRNITEAKNVTDKVIAYAKDSIYGTWKNNVCFAADDNSGTETNFGHMVEADEVATTYFENGNRGFTVNKVYLETFQKVTGASGYTYPDANKKIKNLLQSGILMFNYTGHASPSYLTSEQIYTKDDAQNLRVSKLPLFITATCEFARFDDIETSAGEYVLLNPTGGGIALFSTSRVVFSDRNLKINKQLCKNLFPKNPEDGYMRLGDALRLSKRYLITSGEDVTLNKLGYVLMGDPALKLAYPKYKAEITTVNGIDASEETQTFGAGANITITGQISDSNGDKVSDFSGLVYLTLFDTKEVLYQPLGKNVYDRSNVLYSGKESVVDGEFEVSFVIPKDMSYSYETGRLNIYAADPDTKFQAQGHYENFYMGGTDPEGISDEEPPKINYAYLNNPGFKSGDNVNASPIFFAEVEDETGINISGNGIGHDAVLIIDNSAYETHVLNSYFEAEIGNPGKGTFKFNVPTLSAGRHLLTFRVWDIMNNSATHSFEFNVEDNQSPRIFDLYAYPSPAKSSTNFYLTHDRPDSEVTVKIDVFSLSGQKLWSFEETDYSDTFKAAPIEWRLETNSGKRLQPGVYIYRASISCDGSTESTEAKKMIILAQ